MAGNGSSLFSLSCLLDELCHIFKMIFIDLVDVINYASKLCKVPYVQLHRILWAFTSLFD
jgi:hypothetical protein